MYRQCAVVEHLAVRDMVLDEFHDRVANAALKEDQRHYPMRRCNASHASESARSDGRVVR